MKRSLFVTWHSDSAHSALLDALSYFERAPYLGAVAKRGIKAAVAEEWRELCALPSVGWYRTRGEAQEAAGALRGWHVVEVTMEDLEEAMSAWLELGASAPGEGVDMQPNEVREPSKALRSEKAMKSCDGCGSVVNLAVYPARMDEVLCPRCANLGMLFDGACLHLAELISQMSSGWSQHWIARGAEAAALQDMFSDIGVALGLTDEERERFGFQRRQAN